MRVLVLDNYDSFTWNLVQYLQVLGASVEVVKNDEASAEALMARGWDRILVGPGPCDPDRAGVSLALIAAAAGRLPVLGVCLGHQAIGQLYGGRVVPARRLMHGKTSAIRHDGRGVFWGLPSPLTATRYHSLAVDEASLPATLTITARAEDGEIMGLRHRALDIEGVQFHPESVLSQCGMDLLGNWLRAGARPGTAAAPR